jgi:hypothetical protein
MNQIKKNFIFKNESFKCENCGFLNSKGEGFIRNHCRECLCSLHLDAELPGDRAALCKGIMFVEGVTYTAKKGFVLVHRCKLCNKKIKNMTAPDDNVDLLAQLSRIPYEC